MSLPKSSVLSTRRVVLRLAAIVAGCALLIPSTTHAQSITTVKENGRKVYVNDDTTIAPRDRSVQPRVRLVQYVYWSNTEHRWKPVPSPSPNALRAARSAAAEVHQFVSAQPLTRVDPLATQQVSAKVDPNY